MRMRNQTAHFKARLRTLRWHFLSKGVGLLEKLGHGAKKPRLLLSWMFGFPRNFMCPNQSVELIKVDTFRIRGILKIIFANTTNITRSTRGDEGHERRRANNNNPGLHHVNDAIVANLWTVLATATSIRCPNSFDADWMAVLKRQLEHSCWYWLRVCTTNKFYHNTNAKIGQISSYF